jgi:hypothetical protein
MENKLFLFLFYFILFRRPLWSTLRLLLGSDLRSWRRRRRRTEARLRSGEKRSHTFVTSRIVERPRPIPGMPMYHKVLTYRENHSVPPLVRIGIPPPGTKGRGGILACAREGLGESQFRRLEEKLGTLPTLCYVPCRLA